MNNSLTTEQQAALLECERVISSGLQSFVEVGSALLQIRDGKLYRQTHKNFEAYVKDKWAMARSTANRLVDAAKVISNLSPMGDKPESERITRPLSKLPAEKQSEAWQKAVETAPEGKVTAKHVEQVVEEVISPTPAVTEDAKWLSAMGKTESWGPGGVPIKPVEHAPEDEEPDAVFGLKRYWKKANKKERRQFMEWAQLNTKKGKSK